jgi:ABC-2 type transport system permease protein
MATVAAPGNAQALQARTRVWPALVRRALRDGRVRTLSFVYLFAAVAYIQPISYRHTYPTLESRLAFARSFAHNKAVVLFYGKAYDLLTVGGYSAWRVGGILVIFAAVFGLLAAVRAFRAEEESGRTELVLAGCVARGTSYLASLLGIAVSTALLWLALWLGLVLGGLPAGGAAYLALAVVVVVPVFVGVGALASQLAPTRRLALELGGAVVAVAFVLRVIADTSSGLSGLRWVTPLGWAEELRPFTGARPVLLLLFAVTAGLLLWGAGRIALHRDVGSGLLASDDRAQSRFDPPSSPTAQALRAERVSLIVWLVSVGGFAFIIGVISKSISTAGISKQLERELEKLGSVGILHPEGYIGFSFLFFVLALALFSVSQIAGARHEEADERLETLLALPVSRRGWLGGRLVLAAAAGVVIALTAGVLAWAGAASQRVDISLAKMLEAGANCLPVAFLFLGIAALAFAVLPRATAGIGYGLVAVAFLWQLFGSLFGAPRWLVDLTPFGHVGLVPAQSFRGGAAAIMVAIGVVAALAAIVVFERRDLIGA